MMTLRPRYIAATMGFIKVEIKRFASVCIWNLPSNFCKKIGFFASLASRKKGKKNIDRNETLRNFVESRGEQILKCRESNSKDSSNVKFRKGD